VFGIDALALMSMRRTPERKPIMTQPHHVFHAEFWGAVSSSKCNGWIMAQLRIHCQRRGKVATFPRARVEAMGDGVQLPLHVA